MRLIARCFLLCLLATSAQAESPQVVHLWEQGAPGFEDRRNEPEQAAAYWVKNVHNPSITVFLPPAEKATGAALLICPGGGHRELGFEPEGREAGEFFASQGIAAFALKYRLGREPNSPYDLTKHPREDALRAIRLIRSRAEEWKIDPGRIGMLGFSAGGEVVSLTAFNETQGDPNASDPIDRLDGTPNYLMYVYPGPIGIPERIPANAPPAFVTVTNDDRGAVGNIMKLLTLYREAGASVETHIYARGGHAFNMGKRSRLASLQHWPERAMDWMSDNYLLDPSRKAEDERRAAEAERNRRERASRNTTAEASQPASPSGATSGTGAGESRPRRRPQPQVRYEPGPDSKRQDGVPQGRLEGPFLFHSNIIQNTVRKYWIYVPAQYQPSEPANVLVFQDGARAINPQGVILVPQVLENLIAKKQIPVTIGIFITPGQRGDVFPESIGTGNPDNRDREYDVLDDTYAKFIIHEMLPEVSKKYHLTKDPRGRAIGGSSSGGICAFTVAWHYPEEFGNVISFIGSFTNIHGGHVYPQLVREAERKPIRVFLQDGVNDLRSPENLERDWHLQNQAMVAAFQEKGYDMAYVFGEGGHSDDHGGALLPYMLRWIWRDAPGIEKSDTDFVAAAAAVKPVTVDLFPGFDAQAQVDPVGRWNWERSGRGATRYELTLTRTEGTLKGTLKTEREGAPADETAVTGVELEGNKLTFDVRREFNDRSFITTYQGVIRGDSLNGWSMMEFNGTPRDTSWQARRSKN